MQKRWEFTVKMYQKSVW